MMVLHMGEFSVLDSRCLHCWKAAHQIWNSNLTELTLSEKAVQAPCGNLDHLHAFIG